LRKVIIRVALLGSRGRSFNNPRWGREYSRETHLKTYAKQHKLKQVT